MSLETERSKTRRHFEEILNPDEHLLWYGYCESRRGRQEKAWGGAKNIIYGIMGVAFLSLLLGMLLASIYNPTVGVVGGPLFAIVIFKFTNGWRLDRDSQMYCRKQTIYALTDERVLVFRNCNQGVPVRSVPLRFIDRIRVTGERTFDRGTVEFLSWDPSTGTWSTILRFFMVKDPNTVMDRVEAALGRE